MKIHLIADCSFEADSQRDAFRKLAHYFSVMSGDAPFDSAMASFFHGQFHFESVLATEMVGAIPR